MALFDRIVRRFDLKVVYWGPSRGGKTTSLRSLHAAFSPSARGEIQSIETADERTYFFDYAPLELPRYGDLQVRINAYTVPGQEIYAATRRRILRGVDGVIFVADATAALGANELSWAHLDAELTALARTGRSHPVLLAVNKMDLPGGLPSREVARRLAATTRGRAPIDVVETTAIHGRGIVRAFRRALLPSAAQALESQPTGGTPAERKTLLRAIERLFEGTDDGARDEDAAKGRATVVQAAPDASTDPAGLEVALEATRRWGERDRDARGLESERTLVRIVADVGRHCLAAEDEEDLARSVLATIGRSLGAAEAWMGLPGPGGREWTFDVRGPVAEMANIAALVHRASGAPNGVADVAVPAGTHPWLAPGTRSLVVSFPAGEATPGWVLLAGSSLAEGAEALLPAVGAYVRLGLGRLTAAAELRRANAVLERRVAERTKELARERTSLEIRVRERTRELEEAKRSTVEAERRLLDLERTENVQRLAAGLAHEVNNPIGATRANLDFAIDALQRLLPGLDPTARGDATEALEAVADSRREVARVAESVASLFGGAAASRRVSVRTPVGAVLRDAVDSHARVEAGPAPVLVERATVSCGVPPGECFRWFFRLLGVLARDRRAVSVEVDLADDGPRVTLRSEGPSAPGSLADADDLADEIRRSGGQFEARAAENRAEVKIVLPRAAGDRAVSAPEGVR